MILATKEDMKYILIILINLMSMSFANAKSIDKINYQDMYDANPLKVKKMLHDIDTKIDTTDFFYLEKIATRGQTHHFYEFIGDEIITIKLILDKNKIQHVNAILIENESNDSKLLVTTLDPLFESLLSFIKNKLTKINSADIGAINNSLKRNPISCQMLFGI